MSGSPTQPEPMTPREELEQRTVRRVRRTGYVVLFGAALFIFIPMIVGAVMGIHRDRIWDPYTGLPISRHEVAVDCLDEAQTLMTSAGRGSVKQDAWEERYRRWLTRCRGEHPEAFVMLRATRESLQKPRRDDATEP